MSAFTANCCFICPPSLHSAPRSQSDDQGGSQKTWTKVYWALAPSSAALFQPIEGISMFCVHTNQSTLITGTNTPPNYKPLTRRLMIVQRCFETLLVDGKVQNTIKVKLTDWLFQSIGVKLWLAGQIWPLSVIFGVPLLAHVALIQLNTRTPRILCCSIRTGWWPYWSISVILFLNVLSARGICFFWNLNQKAANEKETYDFYWHLICFFYIQLVCLHVKDYLLYVEKDSSININDGPRLPVGPLLAHWSTIGVGGALCTRLYLSIQSCAGVTG